MSKTNCSSLHGVCWSCEILDKRRENNRTLNIIDKDLIIASSSIDIYNQVVKTKSLDYRDKNQQI
jgi:hypothetical protein